MDTNGFYGDTFSSGFGDFYTAKKRMSGLEEPNLREVHIPGPQPVYQQVPDLTLMSHQKSKRRFDMDANGFYGDTFSSGFGDFYTAKRSNLRPSKYDLRL